MTMIWPKRKGGGAQKDLLKKKKKKNKVNNPKKETKTNKDFRQMIHNLILPRHKYLNKRILTVPPEEENYQ